MKLNRTQLAGVVLFTLLWVGISYKMLFPFNWEIERMQSITENTTVLRLIGFVGFSVFFLCQIVLWIYIWGNNFKLNYFLKIGLSIIGIVFLFSVARLINKIIFYVFLL